MALRILPTTLLACVACAAGLAAGWFLAPGIASPEPATSLLPPAVWPLPLGSVHPLGWLGTQLRIQRNGLAGHLSRMWADVANSSWVGGDASEDGGLRERFPYWINGAVPMAYLLPEEVHEEDPAYGFSLTVTVEQRCPPLLATAADTGRVSARALASAWLPDEPSSRAAAVQSSRTSRPALCARETAPFSLRQEVSNLLNVVLALQAPSGWLGGPANDLPGDPDQYWPQWDILYALRAFSEAVPSQAPRIQAALLRHAAEASRRLDAVHLEGWSAVRWPEWVHIVQRMHDSFDLAPDAPERAMLLALADKIQRQGYDWIGYFTDGAAKPSFNGSSLPFAPSWTLTEHGVNHAMALKEGAVRWRAGGGSAATALSHLKVHMLDAAHGQPSGAFSADECLGGREPNRGVELCTIVETAHSLGLLHRTHGDIAFADRAERIIYNALPGALSEDYWAHNYLSQPNEIFAGHTESHPWRTDGPDSTIYGFAPTYGCCTANFIQGWPKHVQSMVGYRLSPDGLRAAIVVTSYGPVEATFPIAVGGGAHLLMDTDYPFEDAVNITVDANASVDVDLRIPGWAGSTSVGINGAQPVAVRQRGVFHTVRCGPGACRIAVLFSPEVVVQGGWGEGGGVAVSRGPLLFALPVDEVWTQTRVFSGAAADWEVRANSSWNYALLVGNGSSLEVHRASPSQGRSNGSPPFTAAAPRIWLTGLARRVDAWTSPDEGRTADSPPASPVCGKGWRGCGALETVVLVPFGNTRLRVTVMPYTRS